MTTDEKKFVSLWDLQGEMRNEEIMWAYEDVRAAFEDEHPRNMVDASDAYALSVFPFGRDDERPEDDESEIWETGMMVGSGFKVQGSRLRVASIRRCTARILFLPEKFVFVRKKPYICGEK